MVGITDNNGEIGMGVRLDGNLFPRRGKTFGGFPQSSSRTASAMGGVSLFPGDAPPSFSGFIASGFGSVEARDEAVASLYGSVASSYEAVTRFHGFVGPFHGSVRRSFGSVESFYESVEPCHGSVKSSNESVEPCNESVESFYGADKSSFRACQRAKTLKNRQNEHFWPVAWCGWSKIDTQNEKE